MAKRDRAKGPEEPGAATQEPGANQGTGAAAPPPEPLDHKPGKVLFRLTRTRNRGKSGRVDCPSAPGGVLHFVEGRCSISLEPGAAKAFQAHLREPDPAREYALESEDEEGSRGPRVLSKMSVGDLDESPHHHRIWDNEDYVFHGEALKETGCSPKRLAELVKAGGLVRTIRDAEGKEKYHLGDLRKAVAR